MNCKNCQNTKIFSLHFKYLHTKCTFEEIVVPVTIMFHSLFDITSSNAPCELSIPGDDQVKKVHVLLQAKIYGQTDKSLRTPIGSRESFNFQMFQGSSLSPDFFYIINRESLSL